MPFKRIVRRKRGVKKAPYKRRAMRSKLTIQNVKRLINRSQETKMASNEYGYTLFNSAISSSSDLISVLPSIPRGTDENYRIGTTIRPIKMVIRGYINYNTYANTNVNASEILTRMFLVQDKAVRCYTDKSNFSIDFLDKGGVPEQFTGTALTYLLPHNNQRHKFLADKRHVIMKPFGYFANSTNPMASVDKSMFKSFVITLTQKQLPATFVFDENESVSFPINFAPYLALGYADAFNGTPDTSTTQVGISFVSTLYYKDA